MSGWIKFEKSLRDDPRVMRLASRMRNDGVTGCNASALLVVGALAHLWWYADTHARNDDTLDVGFSELDAMLGLPGFCKLMPSDWLVEIDENTVKLPRFQEHNGTEAKKRALTQKRMKRMRDAKGVTRASRSASPDQDQTKTYTKTKEKKSEPPSGLNLIAWDRYIAYRKEAKLKTLASVSIPEAQKKLVAFGNADAQREVVDQTIANGWTGLFEVKANGSHHQKLSAVDRVNQATDQWLADRRRGREGAASLENDDGNVREGILERVR